MLEEGQQNRRRAGSCWLLETPWGAYMAKIVDVSFAIRPARPSLE